MRHTSFLKSKQASVFANSETNDVGYAFFVESQACKVCTGQSSQMDLEGTLFSFIFYYPRCGLTFKFCANVKYYYKFGLN